MTIVPPALVGLTRREALAVLRGAFEDVGIDSPDVDARRLMTDTLGIDAVALVTEPDVRLTEVEAGRLAAPVTRRLAREPVARILGHRWFYGRPFGLGPATLDPRPESETLVEAVLVLLAESHVEAPRLLDIGTGSGCLLLTLLAERADATGVGTDIDPQALAVAAVNADRLGVASRANFRLGAELSPVATIERGSFDVVLSNPPYIPTVAIAALEPEVRTFDPMVALDGGVDGLAMFRRLAAGIPDVQPKGWTVFEVGDDQAQLVASLLAEAFGPRDVELRFFNDLAGIQRCVAVRSRS